MKCFKPYFISSRMYCSTNPSRSGLYIDDLPGISLGRASSVVDGDLATGRQLIEQTERMAYQLTFQDVKNKLQGEINMNSVIDQLTVKQRINGGQFVNISGEVKILFNNLSCDNYASIKLSYIEFISDTDVDGFLFQIDEAGQTTDFEFDIKEGQNRIAFNYSGFAEAITLRFNPSGNFGIWVGANNGINCQDSCIMCSDCGYITASHYINNILQGSYFGIDFMAQTICDIDNIACMFEDDLKYAIWYRMGVLLCEHALSSDRANPQQRAFKSDSIENLLIKWWGGTDPKTGFEITGEYWRSLNACIKGIKNVLTSSKSLCFSCNNFKTIINLP